MRVSDLMTGRVVSVRVDASFKEVVAALLENDVTGVPVVDAEDRVVGVISEADLISKEAFPSATVLTGDARQPGQGWGEAWILKAHGLTAKDVMTAPAWTADPDESVESAARRMVRGRIRRLPVVSEGKLVGIVTRRDILRVFDQVDARLALQIRSLLRRHHFDPPEHEVEVSVEGGVVTLAGRLADLGDADFVVQLVERVEGVVGVRNELGSQSA